MSMNNRIFYNVICQEFGITGGIIIHIDENKGDLDDVHKLISENIGKYPNGVWLIVPMRS